MIARNKKRVPKFPNGGDISNIDPYGMVKNYNANVDQKLMDANVKASLQRPMSDRYKPYNPISEIFKGTPDNNISGGQMLKTDPKLIADFNINKVPLNYDTYRLNQGIPNYTPKLASGGTPDPNPIDTSESDIQRQWRLKKQAISKMTPSELEAYNLTTKKTGTNIQQDQPTGDVIKDVQGNVATDKDDSVERFKQMMSDKATENAKTANYSESKLPPREVTVTPEGNKDGMKIDASTFGKAFGDARNKGLKTFTWNGKLYGTQLAKPSNKTGEEVWQSNRPATIYGK